MKKRYTLFALLIAVSIMAAGCGGKKADEQKTSVQTKAQTETAVETKKAVETETAAETKKAAETEKAAQTEKDNKESYAGEYKPFAMNDGNYTVGVGDMDDVGMTLTLNEDGSANMRTGDVDNPMSWKVEGDKFTGYEETGMIAVFSGTIKDGVLIINYEDSEVKYEIYLAKEGADISGYDFMTLEEYQKATGN